MPVRDLAAGKDPGSTRLQHHQQYPPPPPSSSSTSGAGEHSSGAAAAIAGNTLCSQPDIKQFNLKFYTIKNFCIYWKRLRRNLKLTILKFRLHSIL